MEGKHARSPSQSRAAQGCLRGSSSFVSAWFGVPHLGVLSRGPCWPRAPSEVSLSCQSIHTQMAPSHQSPSTERRRCQSLEEAEKAACCSTAGLDPSLLASLLQRFLLHLLQTRQAKPLHGRGHPTKQQYAPSSLLQSKLSPCPKGCSQAPAGLPGPSHLSRTKEGEKKKKKEQKVVRKLTGKIKVA